jgi:hypothetical protein
VGNAVFDGATDWERWRNFLLKWHFYASCISADEVSWQGHWQNSGTIEQCIFDTNAGKKLS